MLLLLWWGLLLLLLLLRLKCRYSRLGSGGGRRPGSWCRHAYHRVRGLVLVY